MAVAEEMIEKAVLAEKTAPDWASSAAAAEGAYFAPSAVVPGDFRKAQTGRDPVASAAESRLAVGSFAFA